MGGGAEGPLLPRHELALGPVLGPLEKLNQF